MNNRFGNLFDGLVNEISKSCVNDTNLSNIIDEIINYINKILGKQFKIKHVKKEEILKINKNGFMYAIDNKIHYSVELIRETQTKIKTSKTGNYNNITYAMFLIDCIAHELCHCNQYEDNKNGIMTEQTYLNQLCLALVNTFALSAFVKIDYYDRSFEGDAYGNGIAMMRSLFSNEFLENSSYIETYQSQMEKWSFFKKQSLTHEAIYYLDKIPFMHTKRGFEDIIIYANHNLSRLKKDEINALMKKYPLICIGLEEIKGTTECRKKNPNELMKQYFGSYVKYGDLKSSLNKEEKMVLEDIYIYLLIPHLTPEKYNKLCEDFGRDKMDLFMSTLKNNINKKTNLYKNAYLMSLSRINQLKFNDKTTLQNIDEKYAKNKYNRAITYLEDYSKRIDEFIVNKKSFSK